MKKIGILEVSASEAPNLWENVVGLLERKQCVGVTPQAISVWCRQMGHRVHYASYCGIGDPKEKLPNDLDVVFISVASCLAPLAYALSKAYRLEGTRTVIGGPHAKAFPRDALRYCDLVVLDCDKALIADIVSDQFEPGSIVSSLEPYDDAPTIEERLPEIRASVFWQGRPIAFSYIPMLASMGCPYTCDFCADWKTKYRALSSERLTRDLRYASEHLPGVKLMFYDPNFGIRFDETMTLLERIPAKRRNPYLIESSLSNLRDPDRLKRLRDTNCMAVAPGIESWTKYSNKAGVGGAATRAKLDQVVEHFCILKEYVPYLQANFILGLDTDAGDEPFELTREFMLRTPFVFPTLNIPTAYGGTPLYYTLRKEGRILKAMPFTFYGLPYLSVIPKNYDPLSYLQKMVDLHALLASDKLLRMRLAANRHWSDKAVNRYRTRIAGGILKALQQTLSGLQADSHLRAFHAGESDVLPDFYARAYKRQLGRYAELMPVAESRPLLSDEPAIPVVSRVRAEAPAGPPAN